MLKSNSFRWLEALIVAAIGIAAVAVTGYFLLHPRTDGGSPTSVPSFADRPHVPPQYESQKPTLISPELIADQAKSVFTGPLGDFLVTPRVSADSPSCPEPRKQVENYKDHELYSHVSGAGIKVVLIESGANEVCDDADRVGRRSDESHVAGMPDVRAVWKKLSLEFA